MTHWTYLYRENIVRHHQRPGQAMFNAWHDTHPHIANKYRGTDADCFNHDANLATFVSVCVADLMIQTMTGRLP